MSASGYECRVEGWLSGFGLDPFIADHAAAVVRALPGEVRDDLMDDPHFMLHDYDPGGPMRVVVSLPVAAGGARSVVLKRTLCLRPVAFVRWLIAHELAHAHLRNDGRWEGEDPEHAADALAAAWGFPRPPEARPGGNVPAR